MPDIKSLCVYCGSSNRIAAHLLEAAFRFGRTLGHAGIELVFGGGRVGMMGRVADGCLVEGGRVVGVIPSFLNRAEVPHQGATELILVDTMHDRKRIMAERADAFAVLPGGIGTLDEMFEILTWRQLGLHDKPIVLVDIDNYWKPLEALLARIVEEKSAGTLFGSLISRVDCIDAVLPALAAVPPSRQVLDSWRF